MTAPVTISNGLAILAGPRTSFLDHIIPLCHFWQIPLLCTDHWVYTCAQTFYPSTPLILAGHATFQDIVSNYRTVLTVEPCHVYAGAFQFGEFLYKGDMTTIAGFHGNPTKFRSEYWIERYAHEDIVLVYGQYLIDYLKEKGVWNRLKQVAVIGNIRQKFYHQHKVFFDAIAKPHLFSSGNRKTIFWASTWSFPLQEDYFSLILDAVPMHFQMIVKLHPYMFRLYPEKIIQLKEKYADKENILILDEIPLIYPIMEQADIYIGDYSSVAYDFLSLDRPLFCTSKQRFAWATPITDLSRFFNVIEHEDRLSGMRQKTYKYVFQT